MYFGPRHAPNFTQIYPPHLFSCYLTSPHLHTKKKILAVWEGQTLTPPNEIQCLSPRNSGEETWVWGAPHPPITRDGIYKRPHENATMDQAMIWAASRSEFHPNLPPHPYSHDLTSPHLHTKKKKKKKKILAMWEGQTLTPGTPKRNSMPLTKKLG